jgi:RNA polymerase sigma-B factor
MTISTLGARPAPLARPGLPRTAPTGTPRSSSPVSASVAAKLAHATPTAPSTASAFQPEQTAHRAGLSSTDVVARERTDVLLGSVSDETPLDLADVDTVVLLNLGLADGIASRYLGRGLERDDLVQVARLGLVKAVRRYRPALGQSFAGFAAPTISGEIKRHFRDTGWMVRPPRRLQELGARLRDAEKELEQQLHRRPTPAEIATLLGVDESEVRAAREASSSFHAVSLDLPMTTEHRPDVAVDDTDDPFAALDDSEWLGAALHDLTDRERTVLRLRFVESMTQSQIAEHIGVSQMQVSRILRATLSRLRCRLESSMGDAA